MKIFPKVTSIVRIINFHSKYFPSQFFSLSLKSLKQIFKIWNGFRIFFRKYSMGKDFLKTSENLRMLSTPLFVAVPHLRAPHSPSRHLIWGRYSLASPPTHTCLVQHPTPLHPAPPEISGWTPMGSAIPNKIIFDILGKDNLKNYPSYF